MSLADQDYNKYLAAADKILGPLEVGKFGVHDATLVKKLSTEEFQNKYLEFKDLHRVYTSLVSSGATIDDAIYQELKTMAKALLMTEKGRAFGW